MMVLGPTGVGKTTLRMRTERILIEHLRPELETNRWRIPVAGLEAIAPDSGSFCWRSYFKRLLEGLSDPLADRRRLPGSDADGHWEERFKRTARSSGSEYRDAVETDAAFAKARRRND
jgi:hypothetical protein